MTADPAALDPPRVNTPRRFYLLKAQAAEAVDDDGLMHAWIAKHEAATSYTSLPDDFPHAADLAAIDYTTWADLDGADVDELVAAGLDRRTATAVITARGTKMGYTQADGEWADTESVTLAASASRNSSAEGDEYELGDRGTMRLLLDCTVQVGSTLDVAVDTSYDGDTWREIGTFTQVTGVSSERKSFSGCDRFVRVGWTIAGGAFTFSVSGEAV